MEDYGYDGGGEPLPASIEDRLAAMSADEFGALVARVRPPDDTPTDPKSVAAQALRDFVRVSTITVADPKDTTK